MGPPLHLPALANKVAVVTGGASGIGRATAVAFSHAGATVVVGDVDEHSGKVTVDQIRAAGGVATFICVNVASAPEVAAFVTAAVDRYGQIDCAFNNAGVIDPTGTLPADELEEEFDRVIATNLKGVWLCMKYEIQQMLRQGGGTIVNTASIAGLVGFPGSIAYVASKHGVVGMTKGAALAYAREGIRVNAVCPGYVHTPMVDGALQGADPKVARRLAAAHPIGRLGRPEEIAAAVLWLCSEAASFVTGHMLTADGGFVAR